MRRPFPVSVLAAAAAAAAVLLATGCGTTEAPAQQGAADPVRVRDANGTHTLPRPATRVVALEWSSVEYLLDAGVTPVGVADVKGYNLWVGANPVPAGKVKDVGMRGEASVDSIAGLDPDLIVVEGGCGKLGQFTRIARTLCYSGTDPDSNYRYMRDTFTQVATAVGRAGEAKRQLATLDRKLADGKRKLAAAGFANGRFAGAHGWMAGGAPEIRMFGPHSLAGEVAAELGLRNAWDGKQDAWGLQTTDAEGLTELGDVKFFYVAPEDNVFENQLPKNRIWRNLSFVKDGEVHGLDGGTWLFGGVTSTSQYVDELVKAFG